MVVPGERWHVVADNGPGVEAPSPGSRPSNARVGLCVRGQASNNLPATGTSGRELGVPSFTRDAVRRKRRGASEPPLPSSGVKSILSVPVCVRSDLEDFFEQFDLQRSSPGNLHLQAPPGLTASELAKLHRIRLSANDAAGVPSIAPQSPSVAEAGSVRDFAACAGCEDSAECVVCLGSLCEGELLLEMPCDGRHRLHEPCARTWLTRSAACPLCRVDVRKCLGMDASGEPATQPLPASQQWLPLVHTRHGGILRRFEPWPLPTWERPVYIPAHAWHMAQYFEVSYPGFGDVRVWRVSGSGLHVAGGDLVAHEAVPGNAGDRGR